MLKLNVNNYSDEVDKSDVPVLIDFYADWCGPCKMLSPIIEQLDSEFSGRLKVCKVNVDEESELASKFGVMSIPTVVIIKDGKIADQSVGFVSKDQLADRINGLM